MVRDDRSMHLLCRLLGELLLQGGVLSSCRRTVVGRWRLRAVGGVRMHGEQVYR